MSTTLFDTALNISDSLERGLTAPAQQLPAEEVTKRYQTLGELSRQKKELEIEAARLQRQIFGQLLDYTSAKEKQMSAFEKEKLKVAGQLAVQTSKAQTARWVTVTDQQMEYLTAQQYGDLNTQQAAKRATDFMAGNNMDLSTIKNQVVIDGASKQQMIDNYLSARGNFTAYKETVFNEALNLEGPSLQQVYRDSTSTILLKKAQQELTHLLKDSGQSITAEDLKSNTNFGSLYGDLKGSQQQQAAAVQDLITKRTEAQRLSNETSQGGAFLDFNQFVSDDPSKQRQDAMDQTGFVLPEEDADLRAAINEITTREKSLLKTLT